MEIDGPIVDTRDPQDAKILEKLINEVVNAVQKSRASPRIITRSLNAMCDYRDTAAKDWQAKGWTFQSTISELKEPVNICK